MTSNDIIFCTNETCSKRTVCRRGQKPTFTFASFCPFEPQCDTVERFRCDHFWPVNGEICNVCGHSLFLHAEYDYTGDTIRCCDCTVDGGFALAARWMGWETVAFGAQKHEVQVFGPNVEPAVVFREHADVRIDGED